MFCALFFFFNTVSLFPAYFNVLTWNRSTCIHSLTDNIAIHNTFLSLVMPQWHTDTSQGMGRSSILFCPSAHWDSIQLRGDLTTIRVFTAGIHHRAYIITSATLVTAEKRNEVNMDCTSASIFQPSYTSVYNLRGRDGLLIPLFVCW